MKEEIRAKALELGAFRCGFTEAMPVGHEARRIYESWINDGKNGEMSYCANYMEQRNDPRLLFVPAPKTIIACAFQYAAGDSPIIASYALCDDYHFTIKNKLRELGNWIVERWGGEARAFTDSAPIRERYWAQRAGIGFVGLNNQLIVPGAGSYFFLGELLWTGEIEPDSPCELSCGDCKACVKACPGRALDGIGGCDARKCVSYLTIEHRGPLPPEANLNGQVYGCDICLKVCPHNKGVAVTEPQGEIASLTAEKIIQMSPSHYRKITEHSAMRRAPLKQLQRNILHITKKHPDGTDATDLNHN